MSPQEPIKVALTCNGANNVQETTTHVLNIVANKRASLTSMPFQNQIIISGIHEGILHDVAREVATADGIMSAFGFPDGTLHVTVWTN